jgi:hypothetical protein
MSALLPKEKSCEPCMLSDKSQSTIPYEATVRKMQRFQICAKKTAENTHEHRHMQHACHTKGPYANTCHRCKCCAQANEGAASKGSSQAQVLQLSES